ncbi:hypothetical protein AN639_05740 [Candidatus Epulonipiscium fishelsonii]|uniref:Uncharacterized protein n=1 Tax=Candidatus Epulonipiscium fishelsonii TaxID=77094 RepID=A0ACC8XH13_9FIRM|nr:hypothetical protein AN639_05740 [Epulopiscium sp. SCG-B05WGA-EpuloA1]ONI42895.1 hypothetical protein AN396_12960 [Epulopiscium sp. SCG-B11WGA-EpuloA1]
MRYNTQNKQLILEYIKKNKDKYVSVNDIQQELINQGNNINKSTIYRYIDQLLSEKLILKYTAEKKAYFKYIEDNESCHTHLHMKCKRCGLVVHLPTDLLSSIEESNQFKVEYETSIVQGICNLCQ